MPGMYLVDDLHILDIVECSGHFPIVLKLNMSSISSPPDEKYVRVNYERIKWNPSLQAKYMRSMENKACALAQNYSLGEANKYLMETISSVAVEFEMNKEIDFKASFSGTRFYRSENPWFDKECKLKKREARKRTRQCKKNV